VSTPVLPCSLRRSSPSNSPRHWQRQGRRGWRWWWRRRPSLSQPQWWRGCRQQDRWHHHTDYPPGQGRHPLAILLQPLYWHHQHVVGPVHAIGPAQTVARLLRCNVGGATVHASSGSSVYSLRSATSGAVLDVVVRVVGSIVPCQLLQHHGAHSPHDRHRLGGRLWRLQPHHSISR
jgi:hypothetical protein